MPANGLSLDQEAINTLRMNGVQAINNAASGHPGIVLGAAPIIHTLFTRHMVYDVANPTWINRDRFILSAGHGSALLYSLLNVIGLMSDTDLSSFRQLGSAAHGHPEVNPLHGIEATTGPLGQGIAFGVGLATAEAHLHAKFAEISHYTYVLCGDGDLQEGVAFEAMAFAGRQELNKLIVLHDSNDVQLDTDVALVSSDDLAHRAKSLGWAYLLVRDGNDVNAIDAAITQAKGFNKPTLIEVKTVIGLGAPGAGTSSVHGQALGEGIAAVRAFYHWEHEEIFVPAAVKELYTATLFKRSQAAYNAFKPSAALTDFLSSAPADLQTLLTLADAAKLAPGASREVGGHLLTYLANVYPQILIGSADLSSSTKTVGPDGHFSPANRQGRNILFGVREFAMAAIANGIALHSTLYPVVSTFLVFSDYMKGALRLAALMKTKVVFVFTHDSVLVGEDGPTHQPIEQLAALRSIPNLAVFRPADEHEVAGVYSAAFSTNGPTAIILSRQKLPSLATTNSQSAAQGPYYVRQATQLNAANLLASGAELALALTVGAALDLNVISVPCFPRSAISWDINQSFSIEAASTFGWAKLARFNLGIDRFGLGGQGQAVYAHFGFSVTNITLWVQSHLAK